MVTPAERKEGKKATAAATWCVVMGRGRLMKYVEMLLPTTPCGGVLYFSSSEKRLRLDPKTLEQGSSGWKLEMVVENSPYSFMLSPSF